MASIYELAQVSHATRDGGWQVDFFKGLPSANLKILNEAPATGPDGWPYLLAAMEPDSKESFANVMSWLSTRGIGLVINPHKEMPDAVLTYGMVWNYRQSGRIFSTENDTETADSPQPVKFELIEGQKAHVGGPSEEYLPEYVRAILRSFFRDNNVENPRVLVMSTDQKNYDLCFSIESLGHPAQDEHGGILEALAWFLPAHYSLAILSEAGLPKFTNL